MDWFKMAVNISGCRTIRVRAKFRLSSDRVSLLGAYRVGGRIFASTTSVVEDRIIPHSTVLAVRIDARRRLRDAAIPGNAILGSFLIRSGLIFST